jgi:RHS repeat-associated protein
LNRLVKKTLPDGKEVLLTYDDPNVSNSMGRLTKVTDSSGSMEMAYDEEGNIITTILSINELSDPFIYTKEYDNRNRPVKITLPDGKVQEFIYTIAGNLEEVRYDGLTYAKFLDYFADGKAGKKVTHHERENQTTTLYTYGANGNLASTQTKGPTGKIYQYLAYTFDDIGNVAAVRDLRSETHLSLLDSQVDTNESQAFSYDELNRLIQAKGGYGDKTFDYDTVGNITTFHGKKKRTLNYDGLRAVSGTDFTATYDDVGNMTEKTLDGVNWKYTYDDENRLTQVEKDNTRILEFSYNYTGQRVKKIFYRKDGSRVTTWYIGRDYEIRQDSAVDPQAPYHTVTRHLHLGVNKKLVSITEKKSGIVKSSALVAQNEEDEVSYYEKLGDILYSVFGGSPTTSVQREIATNYRPVPVSGPAPGTWYYHSNHLGSSTLITDGKGKQATRILYQPFGEIDSEHSTGIDQVTHKFTGQEMDGESGLMYYAARYYDPSIGRFITTDSMVPRGKDIQSHNRYAYVVNNPINYTDPTGHWDLRKTFDKAREIGTKAIKGILKGAKREFIAIYKSEGFIIGYAQKGVENVRGHSVNFIKNPSKEFRENQNLRLGAQIAVTYYGGPWGAAAYAAFATKAYGGSDENAIRAAAIAGAAAYAHNAIGAGGGIVGAPIRIVGHGVVGGLAAEANGGNFDDGFQESADSALYKEIYYGLSGDDPTWKKGGKSTRKGEKEAVANTRNNNIGKSRNLNAKGAPAWDEEGGTVSLLANEVPGMNSGSVMHDYIAFGLETAVGKGALYDTLNLVTIVPVIAINYYYGLDVGHYYSEDQLRRSKYESAK